MAGGSSEREVERGAGVTRRLPGVAGWLQGVDGFLSDHVEDLAPGWGLNQRSGHWAMFHAARLAVRVVLSVYQLRVFGVDRVPREGGVLLVANHQSFLDPPIVGCPTSRIISYMARDSLLAGGWSGRLLRWLGAYGVRRGEADVGAIKQTIRLLRAGRAVLVFPEATRTEDGQMRRFAHGFVLLARRAEVPIVPVAIEGAFAVWPRWRRLPRLCGRIGVSYEPVIAANEVAASSNEAIAERVHGALVRGQNRMRAGCLRGWVRAGGVADDSGSPILPAGA